MHVGCLIAKAKHQHQHISSAIAHRLTLKALKQGNDWLEWQQTKFQQLDQYETLGMFGDPIPCPPDASTFHWVWV